MSPLIIYLFRNITHRPFVRALVVFAMIVVSATVGGVAALVSGLQRAFNFQGHANRVMVTSRNVQAEKDSQLVNGQLNGITADSAIRRSSPEAVVISSIMQDEQLYVVQMRGLTPIGFEMHGMQLMSGREPTPGASEVMIGDTLLEVMPGLKIGGTIRLMATDMSIVGVFHAEGFLSGEAWTTREWFMADSRRHNLAAVYLDTSSPQEAEALAERLNGIKALKVFAITEPKFFAKASDGYNRLVRGLAIVMLLVVIGSVLASASLIALLQQRALPELCVMRAMGFRATTVTMLILGETEFLTLLGGLVGIIGVMLLLRHYIVYTVSPQLTPILCHAPLTPPIAGLAVGVMMLIGFAGALVPITRMRRTDISRGLREE